MVVEPPPPENFPQFSEILVFRRYFEISSKICENFYENRDDRQLPCLFVKFGASLLIETSIEMREYKWSTLKHFLITAECHC
jgi:hypothetical protein